MSADGPAKPSPLSATSTADSPPVRTLRLGDAPACVALARERGWDSDVALWTKFLTVGEGLGVEDQGKLVAAVVLNRFGPRFATLAMMLVAVSHARRGVGFHLVTEALARAGDATVSLYASAMGKPLYARLGFVDDGASLRLEGSASSTRREVDGLRPLRSGDLDAIVALDAEAQSAPRDRLVRALAAEADRAWVVDRGDGITGFGFASLFRGMRVLSPIVAAADADARALASALAFTGEGTEPLRIDLEPGEEALRAWALDAGLKVVASTPRMVRGAPLRAPRAWVRAIAGRPYG